MSWGSTTRLRSGGGTLTGCPTRTRSPQNTATSGSGLGRSSWPGPRSPVGACPHAPVEAQLFSFYTAKVLRLCSRSRCTKTSTRTTGSMALLTMVESMSSWPRSPSALTTRVSVLRSSYNFQAHPLIGQKPMQDRT
jgi:hypothetical protein